MSLSPSLSGSNRRDFRRFLVNITTLYIGDWLTRCHEHNVRHTLSP
jgi:hypothetical protein